METQDDTLVKLTTAAEELAMSPFTLLKWARMGQLPGAVKLGRGRWRIQRSALQRMKREGILAGQIGGQK